MPIPVRTTSPMPAAITVAQMAVRLGLSRRRFYELVEAGKFPPPTYLLGSRRPVYLREGQEQCVQIKATGIAFDGAMILFNERLTSMPPRQMRSSPVRQRCSQPARDDGANVLVEQLAMLGVMTDAESVQRALTELYPQGTDGSDEGQVVRTLLRRLRAART